MVAEERLRKLSNFLKILTAWYSFCLIVISVANLSGLLRYGTIEFSATLMSIALFGISLFLLGGRLDQRADDYRKCYLSLKSIYHSSETEEQKMQAYDKELPNYQNHKPIDYDLMISQANSRRQKLWNDEGEIELTDEIEKRVKCHVNGLRALSALAMILPFLLFFFAYLLSGSLIEQLEARVVQEAQIER